MLSSFPFVALARDFVVFNPAQLKTWWVIFQPITSQPTLSIAHDSVSHFLPYIRPAPLSALQDVSLLFRFFCSFNDFCFAIFADRSRSLFHLFLGCKPAFVGSSSLKLAVNGGLQMVSWLFFLPGIEAILFGESGCFCLGGAGFNSLVGEVKSSC
ncbi:MAG TPA: hypothetical protein VIM79_18855 [Niastella sp.]